jgi:hypothetical protein
MQPSILFTGKGFQANIHSSVQMHLIVTVMHQLSWLLQKLKESISADGTEI